MALRTEDFIGKTWFDSIILCISDIGEIYFSLNNVYEYEEKLSAAKPDNRHVQDKIRQTLQNIRKAGIIEFLNDKGNYQLIKLELLPELKIDYDDFKVTETALPNAPLREMRESAQPEISGTPRNKTTADRQRDLLLGNAGENAIVFRERRYLADSGRQDLAEKVEQVSQTKGDYIGYDILSFQLSGEEKWIEVKTTTGRQSTKFHISENQIKQSENNPQSYQLHRLYDFNFDNLTSNLYIVAGNLRQKLELTPTHYLGAMR